MTDGRGPRVYARSLLSRTRGPLLSLVRGGTARLCAVPLLVVGAAACGDDPDRPPPTPATLDASDATTAAARAREHCGTVADGWECGTIVAAVEGDGPDDGDVWAGDWLATVVLRDGTVTLLSNYGYDDEDPFFALVPVGAVVTWSRDGGNNIVEYDEIRVVALGPG